MGLHRNISFGKSAQKGVIGDGCKKTVELLVKRGFRISFAESCTGGLAAARLVEVPDASKVFDVGVITYANEAKIKYLGVFEETIEEFGVVSEEVAGQMAEGVADYRDCRTDGRDKEQAGRHGLLRFLCGWDACHTHNAIWGNWQECRARSQRRICVWDIGKAFGKRGMNAGRYRKIREWFLCAPWRI